MDVIKVGSSWKFAYNNASFHFILAQSAGFTGLTQVGSAVTTGALGEGARFNQVAGVVYPMWGTISGGIRIFNLSDMTSVGSLTPSGWDTSGSPAAHPTFIPVTQPNGNTINLLLAFSKEAPETSGMGAQYGSTIIFQGADEITGREFNEPLPTY